tara:strand:- start:383 stop:1090 length:708 start_codon:yes stop_codon:yes gene_type:complete
LTDLYFPQLGIHIEVDEGHHLSQEESDALREADIINATSHVIIRIPVTDKKKRILDIDEFNVYIDESITQLELRLKELEDSNEFVPWKGNEHTSQYWIDRGYIRINDDCAFHTIVDAVNCFGQSYKPKSIWSAGAKLSDGETYIWCPKLYPNDKWYNEEIDDIIIERCLNESKRDRHVERITESSYHKRIVFARVKDNLGQLKYRFKGLYKLDTKDSNKKRQLVWRRIQNRVETF